MYKCFSGSSFANTYLKKTVAFFSLALFTFLSAVAQPANDNCANAHPITISNSGYGFGTFTSPLQDITAATVQSGETYAPAILVASQTQKSIWYKFSLPTNRSVRVTLGQPASAIAAGDIGFAVYKTDSCLPRVAQLSTKLTPIALFGSTYHPCVDPGEYLVQVSAKSSANGPVFVQIKVTDSSGADYDHPENAYQFGTLSNGPFVRAVNYDIDCQSMEDGNETCSAFNSALYTKTTWHTFKTPAYFDYVSVLLAHPSGNFNSTPVIGYRLYKGDARTTPLSSLTVVHDCDSFKTAGYYPDKKTYRCGDLDTSTVYSVQLFFHKNFNNTIRLAVAYDGSGPTQAPEPILSAIPASNKLGVLPSNASGIQTTATDRFGCNSLHAAHPCLPTLPAAGILYGNARYRLSAFFTFSLASTSRLNIRADGIYPSCNTPMLMRLFTQGVSNNCTTLDTANMVAEFMSNSNFSINCMPPGDYTLQVLGRDTAEAVTATYYGHLYNAAPALCLFTNLSQRFQIYITTARVKGINKFSLNVPGAVDSINAVAGVIAPLVPGTVYSAQTDTFGCSQTLLPDTTCGGTTYKKAMFREFAIADSGLVNINASASYVQYMLFKGSASALAAAQNVNSYPSEITGLTRYSECKNNWYDYCYGGERACLVPGNYTFVSYASDNLIGTIDKPSNIYTYALNTIHHSPALAEDLGSIIDSVGPNGGNITVDADYFSCKDNAETINGYAPCNISGRPSTKAIYRQFYLSSPAVIRINGAYGFCGGYTSYGGYMTLFNGKATDGLNTLTPVADRWKCFQNQTVPDLCSPLPAGWYTVVSYGVGPSYASPMRHVNGGPMGYSSYVGLKDQFTITVTKACPGPKYNRPYKAAVDSVTHQPYLIQWGPRVGHTAAYPKTDTTYTLYREDYNCTVDTPFSSRPIVPCVTGMDKVTYYVFRTTQESYVQIDTKGYWAKVYNKDVRVDSLFFDTLTPIQPCQQKAGYIQLCRLQPGTYTLVLFAANSTSCTNVQPTIYIDQVGYSRFDHAANAYDFGTLAPDSAWHDGKMGDVNPLNAGRAPSNDFYYCTTGSRTTDPTNASCGTLYNPHIYNTGVNNPLYTTNQADDIPKRNLWYTFVANQGGYVRIKVANKTIGKGYIYRFAVYKSNVDGTLPFSTVQSSGGVDSTLAQGLTYITANPTYYWCYNTTNEISFYRDPCNNIPERYYIVVENTNAYPNEYPGMKPNSQVEVSILMDSVQSIAPLFDHYSQAYNFGSVGAGTFTGATDNYSCATRDAADPIMYYSNCTKTLWYKFTSTITGNVRYRISVNGVSDYNYDNLQLFRQIVPGDSSSTGLSYQTPGTVYDNGFYWSQACVTPGTYYILLTGCNRVNQFVYPQIKMIEQAGDFCSAPVVAGLNGPGTSLSSVIVDCHTIGTDYGEFNPQLTCPAGAVKTAYKSSWFRIDITGNDTLDVTAFLQENTNAQPADIQYRMMTGNCGAMQEQSCVQDAQTQNTYKCLAPGSYYLQVFTPVLKNGANVTGDIKLNLSAVVHADTCAPLNNCLSNANFIPQFDCTTGDSVRFVNYSTYGSAIQYTWDFGYAGQTSSAVAPAFFYPALPTSQTYTITLTTRNTSCNGQNTATAQITIPGRPYINLGRDTALCNGGSLTLNATSHSGSTYLWSNGATTPTITVSSTGVNTYWARVTYNGCIKRDTIRVFINPITGRNLQRVLCNNADSIQLSAYRGYGETYLWSTGATGNNIYVSTPGTYYADILLNGCVKRDTFTVTRPTGPFPNDTAACFRPGQPFVLSAVTPGATGYSWQNGSGSSSFNVTAAGIYWVNINFGSCSLRDSINVTLMQPVSHTATATICEGRSYTLPGGGIVTTAGVYTDTVKSARGCDSLITSTTLTVTPANRINTTASICAGQNYTLPWGTVVNTTGIYRDTVRTSGGCDSLIRTVNLTAYSVIRTSPAPVICQGQTYTLPSGTVVSTGGTYQDTIRYAAGCDSLVSTVNLTVQTAVTVSRNVVICTGGTYTLPSGAVVSAAGTYRDTLRHSGSGCDSVRYTVQLSVTPVVRTSQSPAICAGQSYILPSGTAVNTSGIYSDTVRTVSGCDSLIATVTLTVKPVISRSLNSIVCSGQFYTLPSGTVVTASGTYLDTLRYVSGCDSVVSTVNLTVRSLASTAVNQTICAGQQYILPSGVIVNASGTYRDTLRYSGSACDSLITTLTLTVKPVLNTVLNPAICVGQSYTLPSGSTVSTTGTYRDTVRYVSGCDSLRTMVNLTVKTVTRSTANASICAGQVYVLPGGGSATMAGTYIDTLRYVSGCDSAIITTQLGVNTFTTVSSAATVCQGQTYTLPWGAFATAAGTYRDTLRYVAGCDSLIRAVTLTVTPRTPSGIKPLLPQVCQADSLQLIAFGGTTYRWIGGSGILSPNRDTTWVYPPVAGIYRVAVYDARCNTTDTLSTTVRVAPLPDLSLTKSNDITCMLGTAQLTVNGAASYRWWPQTGMSNASSSSPTVYPGQTTVFHVVGKSADGCENEDSIEVKVLKGDAGNGYLVPSAFTPNGDGHNDCFGIRNWGAVTDVRFHIYDRYGKAVFSTTDPSQCWDGTVKGIPMAPAAFVYIITANTVCGPVMRKGTVVLIR